MIAFQDTETDMTASTPRRVIPLHPVPSPPPSPPSPPSPSPLMLLGLKLWRDDMHNGERNRREWLRAVAVVRASSNGWRAERHAQRLEKPQ